MRMLNIGGESVEWPGSFITEAQLRGTGIQPEQTIYQIDATGYRHQVQIIADLRYGTLFEIEGTP